MQNKELLIIGSFMGPFIILSALFGITYLRYSKLYRRIKNPSFPLAVYNEPGEFFQKDPVGYIKKVPIMPFLWWKIVFERHSDRDLQRAARRTRLFFWLLLLIGIGNFFFHVFLIFAGVFD